MMNTAALKSYIHAVENFPKPGIRFRDITPLLAAPEAFMAAITHMADATSAHDVQALVGIEARGFIFASAMAQHMQLPFFLVRKAGKLPRTTASIEYALEYGTDRLEIHLGDIQQPMKVALVDDVLATGGTANAAAGLLEQCGVEVACTSFLMELNGLGGRAVLNKYPVLPLLQYELEE
ncbi:MAG: adenine phosphoribosyltransferase [Xanthomonadales bacterium]|nr:adenine phosphoribosyltransferase [Xanthomonadales bacterium]